jgi:hypothetical protein
MASYATDDKDKIYTEHSENAISNDLEYRGGQTGNEKHDAQYLADAVEAVREQKSQGFKSAFAQYRPAMLWSIVFSSGKCSRQFPDVWDTIHHSPELELTNQRVF